MLPAVSRCGGAAGTFPSCRRGRRSPVRRPLRSVLVSAFAFFSVAFSPRGSGGQRPPAFIWQHPVHIAVMTTTSPHLVRVSVRGSDPGRPIPAGYNQPETRPRLPRSVPVSPKPPRRHRPRTRAAADATSMNAYYGGRLAIPLSLLILLMLPSHCSQALTWRTPSVEIRVPSYTLDPANAVDFVTPWCAHSQHTITEP